MITHSESGFVLVTGPPECHPQWSCVASHLLQDGHSLHFQSFVFILSHTASLGTEPCHLRGGVTRAP